jgi:predicted MFS family arabinose efflux permease
MSRSVWAAAVVLPFCAAYYVSYVLRTVNAVIAPELTRELGLGAADLGFLTSTYFLAFALAQLPVGLALDRFGARRVVAAMMVLATVGVVVFATGHGFATLAIGRGLAGLGVSACLMGAFKTFGEVFPPARQASLTGMIMASGATGALTSSVPLAWAVPRVGWRPALLAVAGAGALSAFVVLAAVPARVAGGRAEEPPRAQLRGLWSVLKSRPFWRYAPQAALFSGGFMALQGLWIVAWLMSVEGHTRAGAATLLLVLNAGLLAGQVVIVLSATRLHAAGIDRERLMTAGLALALLVEGLLITRVWRGPAAWLALGFFNAAGAQVYGVSISRFPAALAGRVSTAVNLMSFVGAFVIQWGLGIAVELLAPAPRALQLGFAALWLSQVASVAWSLRGPTGRSASAPP